ncbi:uroporphyrinogen decarboxylase [Salinarimonas ramus]|uniref:Uroporphyrinogen decarboxylase n=1 Tax=Salinarimonas ramus TaxID=690164 RepID=A0A917Q9M9_9HYPH|nr:uroporphyrinogen decarboxylase [Salinarimonas ramus]GGK34489.1 uroporphyrinogen decarboxylase [Salinarimonas ramus]
MTSKPARTLLRVLDGEAVWPQPIWLMRQAGRYLPEYRETRGEAGGFLELCYNPDFAVEVTLQPIRRFGFDASILFSDILVVPHALGQHVWFEEGEGPRLDPIATLDDVKRLGDTKDPLEHLAPVIETVRRLRAELPAETTLLGFCGAPWTLASYMIAGRSSPEQAPLRLAAYRDPAFVAALIERLVETSIRYLVAQIDAGADAVQIFESMGTSLPPPMVESHSLGPLQRIVTGVKAARPEAKVIVFVRGGGHLHRLAQAGFADAVGIDWQTDIAQAVAGLPAGLASQGNLDPWRLVAGGRALEEGIDAILDATRGRPHVFNLGHGIEKTTPIAHVEAMIARVRGA